MSTHRLIPGVKYPEYVDPASVPEEQKEYDRRNAEKAFATEVEHKRLELLHIAAPELLEALQEVLELLPSDQDGLMKLGLDAWIYDARAAINKATKGENP